MISNILVVSATFAIAYILVPAMRLLALKTGFVDLPTERKLHAHPLPMLGGAAMFVSFLCVTLFVRGVIGLPALRQDGTFPGIIIGAAVMFFIGMIDDYAKTRHLDFPAWPKFLAQILAAAILISFHGTINGIQDPLQRQTYISFAPWLSDTLTVVWIVGIINVFNFLDGLDGLAGGIGALSALTLLVVSTVKGDQSSALSAAALIGATLAFLRFNFYPARIIMGDAGSTFLGYVLAAIAVTGAFKSATVISIFVPILALGLPIFDAIYVVIRRVIENRPVYKADRTHGHYRLMAAGLTQMQTISVLYLVALGFSIMSIAITLLIYR